MKQARPRRSAASPSRISKFAVWLVEPAHPWGPATSHGYMVAPQDDPNNPIALAVTPSGGGGAHEKALAYAQHIADDPDGTWDCLPRYTDGEDAFVLDLSDRAPTDPAPPWMFASRAWRVDEKGHILHRKPVELFPPCPIRNPR